MFAPNLFAHLKPVAQSYEHALEGVHIPVDNPKPVVLHLKFCGRGSAYWNAWQKWKPIADDIAATRRSAEFFAKLGVVGWDNVLHDGKPVPYDPEHCAFVFNALIDANRIEKVDRALSVAMTPDNFTEPTTEGRELGKK